MLLLTCKTNISLSSSSALDRDFVFFTDDVSGAGALSKETKVKSASKNKARTEGDAGIMRKKEKEKKHTSFFSLLGAILCLGAIFLLSFAVPAWTCADTHLKASSAQNLTSRKDM